MAISSRAELVALARATGPQRTQQEIESLKWLQQLALTNAQIAATPAEVKAERSAAALAAIKQVEDAEAVRAAFWNGTKLPARRVAVMCAGLPKERANDALNKFDAFERGTVYVAIDRLIQELEKVKRCMVGGEMPRHIGGVQ